MQKQMIRDCFIGSPVSPNIGSAQRIAMAEIAPMPEFSKFNGKNMPLLHNLSLDARPREGAASRGKKGRNAWTLFYKSVLIARQVQVFKPICATMRQPWRRSASAHGGRIGCAKACAMESSPIRPWGSVRNTSRVPKARSHCIWSDLRKWVWITWSCPKKTSLAKCATISRLNRSTRQRGNDWHAMWPRSMDRSKRYISACVAPAHIGLLRSAFASRAGSWCHARLA